MNIGIVVYSKTEHTFEVIKNMEKTFKDLGNNCTIERVISTNEKENDINKIEINELSDFSSYDLIVFASPVHAFSLSLVMKKVMSTMKFSNKSVICVVTMAFPFKCLGGTRTISKMKSYVDLLDSKVINTKIISWGKKHEEKINEFLLEIKETLDKI